MAGRVYIDTEELTSLANSLKASGTDIFNEYNNTCYAALEQGKECLQLTGLDNAKFFNELKRIYTETQNRINALGDFLLKTVIPKYIDTSDAIAKYFTIELGSEVAKLLGITAPMLGNGAGVGTGGYTGGTGGSGGTGNTNPSVIQENPQDYGTNAKDVISNENIDFSKSETFTAEDGQACGRFSTTNKNGETVQGTYQLKKGVTEEQFRNMTPDEQAEAIEQMTVIEENKDGTATLVAVKDTDKVTASTQVSTNQDGGIKEAQAAYEKGKTNAGAAYETDDQTGAIKNASSNRQEDNLILRDQQMQTSLTTNKDGTVTVSRSDTRGKIADDGTQTVDREMTITGTVDTQTGKATSVKVTTQDTHDIGYQIKHGGSTGSIEYQWMDSKNGNGQKVLIEVQRDAKGNITNQSNIDAVLSGSTWRQNNATSANQREMDAFVAKAAAEATTESTGIVAKGTSLATGSNKNLGTAGNSSSATTASSNQINSAARTIASSTNATAQAARANTSNRTSGPQGGTVSTPASASQVISSTVTAAKNTATTAAKNVASTVSSAASSAKSAISSAASSVKSAISGLFGKK